MKVVALIEDPSVIRKILKHIGHEAMPRGPPKKENTISEKGELTREHTRVEALAVPADKPGRG